MSFMLYVTVLIRHIVYLLFIIQRITMFTQIITILHNISRNANFFYLPLLPDFQKVGLGWMNPRAASIRRWRCVCIHIIHIIHSIHSLHIKHSIQVMYMYSPFSFFFGISLLLFLLCFITFNFINSKKCNLYLNFDIKKY